jgi:hypothetical protein
MIKVPAKARPAKAVSDNYDVAGMLSPKQLDLKSANKQQENSQKLWDTMTCALCAGVWVLIVLIIIVCGILLYHYYNDKESLVAALFFIISHAASFIVGHFLKVK